MIAKNNITAGALLVNSRGEKILRILSAPYEGGSQAPLDSDDFTYYNL
jgi:hypothetical protein